MSTPLRTLMIEDSDADVQVLIRELRDSGYEPLVERVETREGLEDALDHKPWDLIISDYDLPNISAADALAIVRRKGFTMPLIVVSSRGGEEAAVDAIKAGVDDFMTLASIGRLAPAVRRELREVEALRRSEENFRGLFESMPAACFAYDRQGTILEVNAAAEKLYGFTRDQIVGRSMFETIAPPETRKNTEDVIRRVFSGETVDNLEWEDRRSDGSVVYVMTNTTPVYNASGAISMGLSLNIDLTERKLAEERHREVESHKREFYRRTILAATGGKLIVTERDDIERIAGQPVVSFEIADASELRLIRRTASEVASSRGMDEDRVHDLLLCIGEASTNALKHATRGVVSIHNLRNRIMVVVADNGPGIEALVLPEATMMKGYSTGRSLGMGYKAILSVADRVYLATGPGGTVVGVVMSIAAPSAEPILANLPDVW